MRSFLLVALLFCSFACAISHVRFEEFIEEVRSSPASEEKEYLLSLYDTVDVSHSYFDMSYFDCIPIMQQPSVRHQGIKELKKPPPPIQKPKSNENPEGPERPIKASQRIGHEYFDVFGNKMLCENGTIPMRRITFEILSNFDSVSDFLRKAPAPLEDQHKVS